MELFEELDRPPKTADKIASMPKSKLEKKRGSGLTNI